MVAGKLEGMVTIFDFFINGDWEFESKSVYPIMQQMSPQERLEFECDYHNIEWFEYILNYLKGIKIWVLKEDLPEPSS